MSAPLRRAAAAALRRGARGAGGARRGAVTQSERGADLPMEAPAQQPPATEGKPGAWAAAAAGAQHGNTEADDIFNPETLGHPGQYPDVPPPTDEGPLGHPGSVLQNQSMSQGGTWRWGGQGGSHAQGHGQGADYPFVPPEQLGVSIADEEPIFGKWGYKPLPNPSQPHYGNRDGTLYMSIFNTGQKANRLLLEPKMILPKPAKVVAIFGCTGFAGSRIAKRFIEAPEIEEVRLCTRYPDEPTPDLKKLMAINPDKCTLEETNALSRPSINRAIQGCDSVINAINLVTEDFYNLHHDVYCRGTSNIGYQARVCGAERYVHIGGLDSVFNSDSDYQDFKCKGEDMALAEFFYATVLRPGALYGSGYHWHQRGLAKHYYSCVYPDTKLQPVWVNDVAEATFRVLMNPHSVKRVIDLGGPKIMTHMQFALERKSWYGFPHPIPVPTWLAVPCAWANEMTTGRPYTTMDMICHFEADQCGRTKEMNPHIWTWEDIGMKPANMMEAKQLEDAGAAF